MDNWQGILVDDPEKARRNRERVALGLGNSGYDSELNSMKNVDNPREPSFRNGLIECLWIFDKSLRVW